MIKFIKQFFQKKRLAKYKRMYSEIKCSLVYDVLKEQEQQAVKIPVFQEVEKRYKRYNITTPLDLKRVYTQLFFEGAVSGVEL